VTINMVDRVLFDSGHSKVKPSGLKVLKQVSDILKNVTRQADPDRGAHRQRADRSKAQRAIPDQLGAVHGPRHERSFVI